MHILAAHAGLPPRCYVLVEYRSKRHTEIYVVSKSMSASPATFRCSNDWMHGEGRRPRACTRQYNHNMNHRHHTAKLRCLGCSNCTIHFGCAEKEEFLCCSVAVLCISLGFKGFTVGWLGTCGMYFAIRESELCSYLRYKHQTWNITRSVCLLHVCKELMTLTYF